MPSLGPASAAEGSGREGTRLRRLIRSLLAAAGTAVVCAVVIGITDIYLSGHGDTKLNREIVTWSEAGVHLGAGDIILLVAALVAGIYAWTSTKPKS